MPESSRYTDETAEHSRGEQDAECGFVRDSAQEAGQNTSRKGGKTHRKGEQRHPDGEINGPEWHHEMEEEEIYAE